MTDFSPEMGQMAFGQPFMEYEVPDIMEAVLRSISDEYDRVYSNNMQKTCPSPFSNSGSSLITPIFEAHAYSWGDEDQPFNFSWRDLRISWYKYLGRGMSSNLEITPELAAECLNECLSLIRSMDTFSDDENCKGNKFIPLEWDKVQS